MSAISTQQIRAIHTLKSQAGLDDDSYRDFLAQRAGVRSSKELTLSSAITVIDGLKVLAGQQKPAPKVAGALNLSGPYAGICRALWISGYELGVFEHREDTALVAFVKRQTGLDSLNWLRDAEPAKSVIEALKAWLAREAGVVWPRRPTTLLPSGKLLDLRKSAVVQAQMRLLNERRRVPAEADLDALMSELGVRVRAMKGAK